MMLRGVRIDTMKKSKLGTEFAAKALDYHKQFQEITGESGINLNSSDQMRSIFYVKYKLPMQYHPKTKKPTIDVASRNKLLKIARGEAKEALAAYRDYQTFNKLATTYTGMKLDPDGRVHTSYSWIITWRLNSSASPFGAGGNLQNIPSARKPEGKAIRSLFIPDPGKIMLAADYRQAEAMDVAWEAEDLPMIQAFEQGLDTHWIKARELFGIPEAIEYKYTTKEHLFKEPITGQENTLYTLRELGKKCRHAGNYGEGPVMLQRDLIKEADIHFDLATCKKLIQRYKSLNPMTMAWQRRIREQIKATRTLVSSFGRLRQFMGRLNDNLFRAAYAFSPQNTVGEMTQVAGREINSKLPYIDLLMNVHDELVMQLEPKHLETALKEVRELMEIPLEIHGRTLTIPVDFKVGPSWGELEEIG
jgi:DNA polymerase I-like protein with 3'-5' exonuclease and polymerase domains